MNWFFGCVTLLPITVCQLTVGNWIEAQERVSCLSQNSFLHSKWKAYKKKTKMISWSALKRSPVPLLLRIPRPEGYVSEYSSDVTSYTRSRPIDICICFIITRSPLPPREPHSYDNCTVFFLAIPVHSNRCHWHRTAMKKENMFHALAKHSYQHWEIHVFWKGLLLALIKGYVLNVGRVALMLEWSK